MIHRMIEKCVDMNSPYCPCLLAETNHCTFCSRLQGKDECACDWNGVCILYEKFWRDKMKNSAAVLRMTETCEATLQKKVGEKTYVVEFAVSDALAQELAKMGAFVFMRRAGDSDFSHFPVGIMNADGCKITVAIETIGAKSSRFILNQDEKIIVRGPYYNGVLGKPWIDELSNGTVVVLAGGIGQAPALPILRALAGKGNTVHVIAAPGKVGTVFIKGEPALAGMELHEVASLRKDGFALFEKLMGENPDLIVSAGPDDQHSGVIRFMHDRGVNLPMAATNNATMCCGEGICGSCHKLTPDNRTVKMCKAQIAFDRIMQDE